MSGEETVENVETNAEVVDSNEAVETSEETSELSLETIYALDDDQLGEFLAKETPQLNAEDPNSEFSLSEQLPSEASEQAEPVDEAEEETEAENEEENAELGSIEDEDIDYKALYEQIIGNPFKANGREMKVDSPEEVIRLMQQGVNYTKNMQEFAPYRKAMSLLKKRDALDPEKLDFLLDVAEGNPDAVAKLLKDQDVNPYDIDIEAGDNYKSTYEDTEPLDRLDETLANLPEGRGKDVTLSILSKDGWDTESKRLLFSKPESLPFLVEQVEQGIYDTIMDEVTKRKTLGDFNGITDIEAYNMVGNELARQGKLGVPTTPTERSSSDRPVVDNKATQNEKRRKAAGAPRKALSNAPQTETFNPATATDAEVEKFLQDHLRNAG